MQKGRYLERSTGQREEEDGESKVHGGGVGQSTDRGFKGFALAAECRLRTLGGRSGGVGRCSWGWCWGVGRLRKLF